MANRKKNTGNEATGMIRTLLVLFFAIVLRDYSTGNLAWGSTILMAATVVSLFAITAIARSQEKTR